MLIPEPKAKSFALRLRQVRSQKQDVFGKPVSQPKAAILFHVAPSTYCNWEAGRSLPDDRSRQRMMEIWPEVFER